MTAIDRLPDKRLTREQETLLSRRIHKGPRKQQAIEHLVVNNLREASLYAKHYCPKDLFSDGEVVSLCYDVLLKSAPRFRPAFGIRFLAFCKHRLRGAVKRHCTTLDVVKHASEKRIDLDGPTFVSFSGGSDRTQPKERFSDNVGIAWNVNDDDTPTCTQGGTIDFDFMEVDMREWWVPLKSLIREKLNPRQRMVLRLVYDLGFNMQEIGDMLAVSRSAIQMTHSSALEILRRELVQNRELLVR
jgi:RNA polymerase sigma factor (sigma-70 family)